MNSSKFILGCLLLASFFIACNSQTSSNIEESPENATEADSNYQPEMYQASELVVLMRKMYEENKVLKEKIKNGELPEAMPEDYNNILTATPTRPEEIKQSFFSMANLYLDNYKVMTNADKNNVLSAYNNLISTCVACHQSYCMGPIPKIEKLYIK